ncbi:glycosyltransferase [bacterium]|nr:glycosyltransferase [bacterium]
MAVDSKTIRVFHLIKGFGRGGAETLLEQSLRYVHGNRFHYGFGYFLPWKNALVPSMESAGAEVYCFNRKNAASIFLSVPALSKFLRQWNADLLHCHLPLAGIVGRLAARADSLPVVYTEHNVLERYHSWTRRANLLTWNLQKHVIAVSHEVSSSIGLHAGKSVPVTVVQNGIPVDLFSPTGFDRARIRNQWGIPDQSPLIGTVAVFRAQKDLHTWLEAARILNRLHPDTHYMIVGDGQLREEIHDFARLLNLNEVVHFTGLQENVAPYYSAMDIYMSSSIFEGLPLTILEAMAMRLPVVATSVGGIPEVVNEGETGFLVAPRSPQPLADKLSILLDQPDLRKQMGDKARTVAEERFSMERMVRHLEEIYIEVLGG